MLVEGIEYKGQAVHHHEILEEKLSGIYDPDLGIDIVNLGLVYEVAIDDNQNCQIKITFTSPTCDCVDIIFEDVHQAMADMEFFDNLEVKVVWDPAWDLNRITRFGRIALGINPGHE